MYLLKMLIFHSYVNVYQRVTKKQWGCQLKKKNVMHQIYDDLTSKNFMTYQLKLEYSECHQN